jgi:hypothetical protein
MLAVTVFAACPVVGPVWRRDTVTRRPVPAAYAAGTEVIVSNPGVTAGSWPKTLALSTLL